MAHSPSCEANSHSATQKIHPSYGTRRLITVFSGPYPKPDAYSPQTCHLISLSTALVVPKIPSNSDTLCNIS